MKVIGYLRVSTTKQELYRQKDKISKYCEEKNYFLSRCIKDFGVSGSTNNRAGYNQLLGLTNEDCDLLIISEISRLSRNDEVTSTLNDIQNIINRGISVILLDAKDKVYKANENLHLAELIMLIFQLKGAAQERKDIKKKNQDGKMALFRRFPNIVVDAHIPYGYKKVYDNTIKRHILEEYPEELDNVKKAFKLVLEGKTLYAISRYFNERNIYVRKMPITVSYLSRMIRADIYRGIRRRTSGYDEATEATTVEVHIKPAIPENDFLRAGEMIKKNNKHVSSSESKFNPLKGIFKCRCGKSMMVKDKKPQKGVSKLTYRCSSVYPKSSPYCCIMGKDEVSYDLTNTIIHNFFLQRFSEVRDYFNNNSERKINEAREIIEGLEDKKTNKETNINECNKRISENQNKIIQLSATNLDISFIQTLNNHHKNLQEELTRTIAEIREINSNIAEHQTQIIQIQSAIMKDKKMNLNLSDGELSEIYHIFLDKVEYYPYNLMKGTYKLYFKSGQICFVIVNKVKSLQSAYALTDDSTIDVNTGDITFKYIKSSNEYLTLPISEIITINIHDIFNSEYTECAAFTRIKIDTSYRQKYLTLIHNKATNS